MSTRIRSQLSDFTYSIAMSIHGHGRVYTRTWVLPCLYTLCYGTTLYKPYSNTQDYNVDMDKDMDSGHSCTLLRYRRIRSGTVHYCTSRTAIQQCRTDVLRYCTTGYPAIQPDRTVCGSKAPQSVYRAPRKVAGWPIYVCGWLADISSPRAGGPRNR